MRAEEIEGTVLRIERGSIHDGKGLRTVLFLKGCPLSCWWCSTPESQKYGLETGYLEERCIRCGTCVECCPERALSIVSGTVVKEDHLCRGCFLCVQACPQEAWKGFGQSMTVGQAVAEISKDEIFFFHSGGGVTISGGECLSQPDFTAGVIQQCRQRNIDTAIETSLYGPWASIEKILPFVNDFYIDLKHPDKTDHKKYIGAGSALILDNLRMLDESKHPFGMHIRIPLIPGINDGDEALKSTAVHAAGLKKIHDIEILPYHRLGAGTYRQLGRPYKLEQLGIPSQEYIVERTSFVKGLGLGVVVKAGGGYSVD